MPNARDLVVDVHNHWMPQELLDTLEGTLPEEFTATRTDDGRIDIRDRHGISWQTVDIEGYGNNAKRLANMDIAGIDVVLLSAGCYPSWMSMRAARMYNDAGAELSRQHGGRLRPMIHVPPFGEDGILDEVRRAAKLGLVGVGIATNFRGRYPDEDEYLPLLRLCAELDLPLFIHAAGQPVHSEDLRKYALTRSLGRALDHTLVAARMLYSGHLAKLPGLRVVCNHLGGTFFATSRRYLDVAPDAKIPEGGLRPLLDQMLFETAPAFWWSGIEIECAVRSLGATHVALGSDYPAHPMRADPRVLQRAIQNVKDARLSDDETRLVLGGNAQRFYGARLDAVHAH
jgi:predicted TIM-barrel fold metal-dependent hydrolase